MTSRLNPYLTFNGNAREALEFYRSVLGGELTINTFGQFGAPDPALADRVMHGMLVNDHGWALMASDTAPGMPYVPGTNVTVSLSGEQGDGLEDVWAKISDGGSVSVPFEKQMWGDQFGQCSDKFGIGWLVNVTQPK